jgi:hypothetical protein
MAARWPSYPRGAKPAGVTGSQQRRGLVRQPIRRVQITRYARKLTGTPLTGGQKTATVNALGSATISIGPQGLGNIWYPVQCTISTSIGAADLSTCAVYLGSQAQQNLQGGQSYAGGGDVVSLSVQSMSPGDLLIAVWTGGTPGSIAAVNVTGTMDSLVV